MAQTSALARSFGYFTAACDAPKAVKSPYVGRIRDFAESRGLPPLAEIVSDELPAGRRYPHDRLFDRAGGKRLLCELGRGDHLILAELASCESIADLRQVLATLDHRGVVIHVVDVLNGKGGTDPLSIDGRDTEARQALNFAVIVWSTMRSVARWAGNPNAARSIARRKATMAKRAKRKNSKGGRRSGTVKHKRRKR